MIVSTSPRIELLNCDCMVYMAGVPDKFFNLAIVDPPYGINISSAGGYYHVKGKGQANPHTKKDWDSGIPTAEYWKLIRPNIKCDIPQWVDELVDRVEAKREVVGSKKVMGKDINIYGAYKGGDYDITLPASDLAKKYAGYGTCLKPAFEP